MTIETKIGLFVAMGVVILVGILISDHLSVVQEQQPPVITDPLRVEQYTNPDDRDAARNAIRGADLNAPPDQVTRADETNLTAPDTMIVDVRTAIAEAPTDDDGRTILTPDGKPPVGGMFETVAENPLTQDQMNQLLGQQGNPVQHEISPLMPSGPTYHVLKQGETLAALARLYYGRTADWHRILDANRATISDPKLLKPGMQLVIPDIKAAAPATTAMITSTDAQPNPSPREYKLADGETLSDVAAKFLGSSKKWKAIHAANKDRVPNPDRVKAGTVLRIPQAN